MYKYTLNDNEDIIKIFDNLYIKQGSNEKTTSAILTNQRLLFLDYIVLNNNSIIEFNDKKLYDLILKLKEE